MTEANGQAMNSSFYQMIQGSLRESHTRKSPTTSSRSMSRSAHLGVCSAAHFVFGSSSTLNQTFYSSRLTLNQILRADFARFESSPCLPLQKPAGVEHDHDSDKDCSKCIPVGVKQYLMKFVREPALKVTCKRIWSGASKLELNPLTDYPATDSNKAQVNKRTWTKQHSFTFISLDLDHGKTFECLYVHHLVCLSIRNPKYCRRLASSETRGKQTRRASPHIPTASWSSFVRSTTCANTTSQNGHKPPLTCIDHAS